MRESLSRPARRALRSIVIVVSTVSVLVVAAAGVVWMWPGLSLALALGQPSVERWAMARGPQARREAVMLRGRLAADVYRPAAARGSVVLVHGLSRAGREHPELQRFARLLARQGRAVVVPQIPGLAAFRMSGRERVEIAAAIDHARGLHEAVAVVGFSFGAGPALLAAAGAPGVRVVGSFGGYADLRNVLAFVTTGVHRFGERVHRVAQEDYNRWKLLALLTAIVGAGPDRAALEAIAARRLADPGADTGDVEARLGPVGQAVMALVLNRSETRVAELLAAVPGLDRVLSELSPVAVVGGMTARLIVVHGAGDTSIPFTESLRLAAARPGSRLVVLDTFHHTGPRSAWAALGAVRDGAALVGVAGDLLSQ